MKLQELYQNLSFGEFSNLAIGEEGAGTIPVQHQPKILAYTNQALVKLSSRFVILEREVAVNTDEAITVYPLRTKYAETDPTPVFRKYIADTVEDPFTGDVVKIRAVHNEVGERLAINDPTDETSVYTPSFDTLQLNYPQTGNTYFVTYQAKHPVLVPDDLEQEIILPAPLYEALQAMIAHKVFVGMTGEEHSRRAAELLARYEEICRMVEGKDLASDSMNEGSSDDKFEARGWI